MSDCAVTYWSKGEEYYMIILPDNIDETWTFNYDWDEIECVSPTEDEESFYVPFPEIDYGHFEPVDYSQDEYDGRVHIRCKVVKEKRTIRNHNECCYKHYDGENVKNKSHKYPNIWKTYEELMDGFKHDESDWVYSQKKYTCTPKEDKYPIDALDAFSKIF